jgi:tetratricopeptide (TPR) repeat protein
LTESVCALSNGRKRHWDSKHSQNPGGSLQQARKLWRAFEYGQEALRQYEKSKVSRGIADTLGVLAEVYSAQNDFQQALAQAERSTAIYEQLGDRIQTAVSRNGVAGDYAGLGNYDQARKIYEELLKQTEGFGDAGGAAVLRNAIGDTWAEQGRYSALDYYRQALSAMEAGKLFPELGTTPSCG